MRHWLLVLPLLAAPASAAVPSPPNSTVPCLRACPGGDIATTIIVRDFANNPVASSFVEIRLDGAADPCDAVAFCQPVDGGTIDYGGDTRRATKLTDAAGVATFHLRAVSECQDATRRVGVYADGVLLALPVLASLDANDTWFVDPADLAIHATRSGGTDLRSDFVCDGLVDQADLDFIPPHYDHHCTVPVPVRESTWGSLKQIYR